MASTQCMDCGMVVDPNRAGTYREVTGFEKVRQGGGANAVALRRETGNLLCNGCGERRKLNDRWGVVDGQASLI